MPAFIPGISVVFVDLTDILVDFNCGSNLKTTVTDTGGLLTG
jgi:hypothetical protein